MTAVITVALTLTLEQTGRLTLKVVSLLEGHSD